MTWNEMRALTALGEISTEAVQAMRAIAPESLRDLHDDLYVAHAALLRAQTMIGQLRELRSEAASEQAGGEERTR